VKSKFDIEQYLSDGVEDLVKGAIKASLKNPKESAFLARYMISAKRSANLRHQYEEKGEHIPSFLIASITSECNLRCKGCYAHVNQNCQKSEQMSFAQWHHIFDEAADLGVAMILLAGGEPLMERDVIMSAASSKNIIFPIFTNATMIDGDYLKLFDKNRNLVPVISIEGNEQQTDARRGIGIFNKTLETIKTLNNEGLLFGVSITVTTENLSTVTDTAYINWLRDLGCKFTIFVEYVPIELREMALDENEREGLRNQVEHLRMQFSDMILISFPGDEKETGGCLAAGRGFFHINPTGGVEPCPFSPYSDTSLREHSIRDALKSPLFERLRSEGMLEQDHIGGCLLFEHESEVQAMLESKV
jgi:MoaA/NifB/PqqE/SkfB family radical SAM enzyme